MQTMRVYEAIVKGIEGLGVEAAFGGAGENAASLMLALKHSERIRPVITRHEQAASFMACGYAMWTDKLGFCFATAGPGAFNLFSGLAVAMSDSYPSSGPRLNGTPRKRTSSAAEVDHDDRDDGYGCGRTGPGRADVPAAQAGGRAAAGGGGGARGGSPPP